MRKAEPPVSFLRECFAYDPDTGVLTWRHRPDEHFRNRDVAKGWNGRMAGKPVGAPDKDGYLRAELLHGETRYRLRVHRVAYALATGHFPETVDHRNGDPADNRLLNLRAATVLENRRNNRGHVGREIPKNAVWDKGRWRAIGHLRGRKVYLGRYDTPGEANAAWCAWAKDLHGEFFNAGWKGDTVFD